MSDFDGKSSKVNQAILSAPTSVQKMKAVAQILFNISCTQDLQILFSKGNDSKKGHNSDMKKYSSTIFYEQFLYEILNPQHAVFRSFKFHRKVEKSIKI